MKFAAKLKKALESRPTHKWTPRPELLLSFHIPKPMHGLAPRVVLGNAWWQQVRQKAFESTDDHCIACQVHKSQAPGLRRLECHEVYKTDYKKGRLIYQEAVPLCHYCHNSIHSGRLEALLERHQITQAKYCAIIQHRDRVLRLAGLPKPPIYSGKMAPWSKWRLVVNGKRYKPLFKSEEEWLEHFNGASNAQATKTEDK